MSHHGKNPNAGHYTADVKQPDGRWLRFDDATVTSVPKDSVGCLTAVSAPSESQSWAGYSQLSGVPLRDHHGQPSEIQREPCHDMPGDHPNTDARPMAVQVLNDQAYLLFYSKVR